MHGAENFYKLLIPDFSSQPSSYAPIKADAVEDLRCMFVYSRDSTLEYGLLPSGPKQAVVRNPTGKAAHV